MPPPLALLLTSAFVLWLLWQDSRRTQGTTIALWVPLTWFLIISSRFVSEWFSGPSSASYQEGSPIDQPIFLCLIVAAAWTLLRRGIPWSRLPAANVGLALYLAFGLVSIAWSDFPFVAVKRYIKVLGHPLMILVLLTEPNPAEAVRSLFKRCGYLLIPMSVLLIEYYPQYGRGFSAWNGEAYNTGVTTNKNTLGVLCLVIAFFFVWNIVVNRRELPAALRRHEVWTGMVILAMTIWLLSVADSATSLGSLLSGVGIMVALGVRRLREKRLGLYLAAGGIALVTLNAVYDLRAAAIESLGRDSTLTDRTEVWEDVLSIKINPLIGAGFESFWLGRRLERMWAKWAWHPNQAHNGYIEAYLNAGWLGLICLAILIVSCYRKGRADLVSSPARGRLRLGFLAMVLLYNYTEATFKALHPMFFVTFLIALDFPTGGNGHRAGLIRDAPHPSRRWNPVQPRSVSGHRGGH